MKTTYRDLRRGDVYRLANNEWVEVEKISAAPSNSGWLRIDYTAPNGLARWDIGTWTEAIKIKRNGVIVTKEKL